MPALFNAIITIYRYFEKNEKYEFYYLLLNRIHGKLFNVGSEPTRQKIILKKMKLAVDEF